MIVVIEFSSVFHRIGGGCSNSFVVVMSWLNWRAPSNIECMLVTADVSQPPMSSLNDEAASNSPDMSVTADVSQVPMEP